MLAVALTRGWRPTLIDSALALALLVKIVLIFGPALAMVPITLMQFVVCVLLILFGARWLRKAILRTAGWIALHDEAAEFDRETGLLKSLSADRRADYMAGLAAFEAVLLEVVEVVFIVIAVGTAHGATLWARLGGLAAVVVVLLIGLTLPPVGQGAREHVEVRGRADVVFVWRLLEGRGAWCRLAEG